MLTTAEAAYHFGLKSTTLCRHIRDGKILATRARRDYRLTWEWLWACERGPIPKGSRLQRYKSPLLTKQDLADGSSYSIRTVERWIIEGLPTRNSFSGVRMNEDDAREWLCDTIGFELPKIVLNRELPCKSFSTEGRRFPRQVVFSPDICT